MTMTDVSDGDHEAFDITVFNSKFINLRMPVGEQEADNDIIFNSEFKLKLIQSELYKISVDIYKAAGYAAEEIDYEDLDEEYKNDILQFKRENIDYMFEKTLEELTTPNFSKYSIGLWLRFGTKEEIEEVFRLSGDVKEKKKKMLSKKYNNLLPPKDAYSQYTEYRKQQIFMPGFVKLGIPTTMTMMKKK